MQTVETFNNYYGLSGNPTSGLTISTENEFSSTLTDGPDGDSNGSTVAGAPIDWSFFPSSVTLAGFSADGDPVVFDGFAYTLLSNTSGLSGDIGFTASGSYFYCFAEGTDIATPAGVVRIDALTPGDPILTADARIVPVTWIGRQTVSTRFGLAERLTPVRVRAGALGDGLPLRDLVLTADHALLIDGLLINAGALVNGTSIDRVPLAELGDSFTVYHIETKAHDIILAEGTPAETYIDYAGRQAFDNYAEYVALYGADRPIAENSAPRVTSARMLPPALRVRLGIDRAA